MCDGIKQTPDREYKSEAGAVLGPDVSRETRERLETYEAILRQWQRRMNLVSGASLETLWRRHFLDSAQLGPLLPTENKPHIVDVGTGAGFPGMVLAILGFATRISLVEANAKRCAFLREVARATGTNVDIVEGRVETAEVIANLGVVDVVVARACAPLDKLLDLVFGILNQQTSCIFLKGKGYTAELDAAEANWKFDSDIKPSCTSSEGRILLITHVETRS